MEMTKKEYIEKLKKELDTIEVRYQHLLNENCMIGEDFRSQARENRIHAEELQEQIRQLEEEIKTRQGVVDERDLQIVQWERRGENYQMNLEEYLTCYDLMRGNRDQLLAQVAELEQASRTKDNTIVALEEELKQLELLATEGKREVGTQTAIGAAYFNKKPDVGSSRGSGSLGSGRTGAGRGAPGGSGERRVGGGGRVAGKPPAGDARKGSRIDDS